MTKCDNCILHEYDKSEFRCKGDLNPKDCIARLQGALEAATEKDIIFSGEVNSDVIVEYSVAGFGSVLVPKNATQEEIALAILDDCEERELHFEYTDE